jgi:HD-GYP domain-containing protein (c-di-GMP phosphodiesterase class II)
MKSKTLTGKGSTKVDALLERSLKKTEDTLKILDKLNVIGAALSTETNIDKMLEMILEMAQDAMKADGGTLYRLTPEHTLKFAIIQNKTLKIKMGGTSGNSITLPEIPLSIAGKPNHSAISAHCAITRQPVNVSDAYAKKGFDFSGAKSFDAKMDYRTSSVLATPIGHDGALLGVLQLVNCLNERGTIEPFSALAEEMAASLSSQAGIALSNRLLILQLYDLFEGLTNLINTAIDEKSPYTGGHCIRVPELTLMLAEAAHNESTGPLANFQMTDKDRYELKIAGMLHDCGKITTPVHVVDKGTKLETIFDRIELISMRFELARKDLQARYHSACKTNPAASDQLEVTLVNDIRQIDEDLKFLRKCNIGGERMQDEDISRVKQIAQQTWLDHEGEPQPIITENELQNLIIVAGTLTQDERMIINSHIVSTIRLLEKMPWPEHLKNVTEYAGGHHERMDGKGYPKGLTRDQMSLQARMMGIADIFEALTAADRPYKKGMPLSQSIAIMTRMKNEGHIDPDLFDVFIKHNIPNEYAKRHLALAQIDIH